MIVVSLSGRGVFDLSAYQAFLDCHLADVTIEDALIQRALAETRPL